LLYKNTLERPQHSKRPGSQNVVLMCFYMASHSRFELL